MLVQAKMYERFTLMKQMVQAGKDSRFLSSLQKLADGAREIAIGNWDD